MGLPRFIRPVDSVRPYGSHRYDLYGRKVGRRLTLFGRDALQAWLHLETDPAVIDYCERPVRILDTRPARTIDFWVLKQGSESFWILLRSTESAAIAKGAGIFTAFEGWANAHAMDVRLIRSEDLQVAETLRRNWRTMLQYVAANHRFLVPSMALDVLEACRDGMSVGELERRFATSDPVLVRTAAFELVLRGSLHCSTLETTALASTNLSPIEASASRHSRYQSASRAGHAYPPARPYLRHACQRNCPSGSCRRAFSIGQAPCGSQPESRDNEGLKTTMCLPEPPQNRRST